MSNLATEKMLQAVQAVKESASRAEREFDRNSSELQRRAGRTIDLFGGNAVNTVADIASESRKICDSLYSSYQTLVKMLDDQCRPMLDQDPDHVAIRKVRDMIKWLNDESEIKNDFTASLNNRSLGGVASARYVPTMENKMIQSFWETKYEMLPGRVEAEKEERQNRILANVEKRRAREAEIERKNEEEKKRFEAEKIEYAKRYEIWEKRTGEIKKLRVEKIDRSVAVARAAYKKEIEDTYAACVRDANARRKKLTKQKLEAEEQLSALGFFSFGKKKAAKRTIEETTAQLQSVDVTVANAERTYADAKNSEEAWVSAEREKITEKIENENPLPEKPKEPVPPRTIGTAQELENMVAKDAICDYMIPGNLYTITELQENIPELSQMTNMHVSALIRQMLGTHLKRVEQKRKAYFGLID